MHLRFALDLPNPYAAVRRGRQARRGMDRKSIPFRQYLARTWTGWPRAMSETEQRRSSCRIYCRKGRPRLTDLPASSASANWGGLSFWLLFLWPFREKVTRAPQERESAALELPARARATPHLNPLSQEGDSCPTKPGERRPSLARRVLVVLPKHSIKRGPRADRLKHHKPKLPVIRWTADHVSSPSKLHWLVRLH
jgi:hypothetical protein